MARTWVSIKVELLGGRGEEFWPYPGRIFALGPSHTFEDLADAINTAFARWDRAHLAQFTLSDGTHIVDPAFDQDLAAAISGPISQPHDMSKTKVIKTVSLGDTFQFVFDFGDDWVHQCTVDTFKVDPVEVLGIRPKVPLAYWGWGNMPDQYGRRWEDDDGESRTPRRPSKPHPMLTRQWPAETPKPPLDLAAVRGAIHSGDASRFRDAITGPDIDDALQQISVGAPILLETEIAEDEMLVATFMNRLICRGNPGDQELADDLLARLRDEPFPGRAIPVDLEMFTEIFEGDPTQLLGGYVDLTTGSVFPADVADPITMGEDAVIDVEAAPDRYLWFDRQGGREGWQDMAAFTDRQSDPQLRARLEQSIRGTGAFRAFRDIVYDTGLGEQWNIFSTDRQYGRAREFLAAEGIRAV